MRHFYDRRVGDELPLTLFCLRGDAFVMKICPKARPGPRTKIVIIPWVVVDGRNFCGRWPIERERKSGFHLKNPQIYGKNLNIQSAQSPSPSSCRSACHPDFPQSWKNGILGERQIGMNYFHVFGKGRKGSHPDCQPASQSGGRGVGESEGRDTFSNHFHCRRLFSPAARWNYANQPIFAGRLVVLLLQNERERDRSPIFGD